LYRKYKVVFFSPPIKEHPTKRREKEEIKTTIMTNEEEEPFTF
jgi:hypothetical protein